MKAKQIQKHVLHVIVHDQKQFNSNLDVWAALYQA